MFSPWEWPRRTRSWVCTATRCWPSQDCSTGETSTWASPLLFWKLYMSSSFLNFNTIALFFQILYPGAITWRRCSVMFVPLDVCDLGATWGSFRWGGKLDFFWRLRRRQYLRCQEVWYSQHKRHNWGEIKSDLCCWNQIDDYDDSMIYVIWMQRFYVQHQIKSNISKLVF